MVRPGQEELSKTVSYALRHAPWEFELELDEEGWVPVDQLLQGLRRVPEFRSLTIADLERMIEHSSKKRHEIRAGRIRALYGHSLPGKLAKTQADPPPVLYHGTARGVIGTILQEGLRPMGRQYVHLSVDQVTARQVGLRKGWDFVVLPIRALEAARCGVRFYRGNSQVWLADAIPSEWIDWDAG